MKALSIFVAALLIGAATWLPGNAIAKESEAPGSCSFTIKGNFGGTVVNVTITVTDVSLVECVLLKAGVKSAIEKAAK